MLIDEPAGADRRTRVPPTGRYEGCALVRRLALDPLVTLAEVTAELRTSGK
jgi:hypothetical protein